MVREAQLLNDDQDQNGGPALISPQKWKTATLHYDVTVTNPTTPPYSKEVKTHAINGAAVQRAQQFKMRKYAQDFHPSS